MRGDEERQEGFIWLSSGDELVPQGHPLRKIRRMVDQALSQMSPLFDSLYACGGRNSIRGRQGILDRIMMGGVQCPPEVGRWGPIWAPEERPAFGTR